MARRNGSGGEGVKTSASAGTSGKSSSAAELPLTHDQLIEFYRLMYLSRRTDDREIVLKRQQKIFFQVSCAGHEALLVAAGMFALVTAKGPLPHVITRALPRELDTSRDHRLQGLSLTLGGFSALIWTLVIRQLILEPSSPPPPHPTLENAAASAIALMFFVAGVLVSLAARQRDHRTSEVLNGWQQIAKFFRD